MSSKLKRYATLYLVFSWAQFSKPYSQASILHGPSDSQFCIATIQKKNMIRKTSFMNHKSPCDTQKIFKLLNKRKERWNNVEKTAVIFPEVFCETLGALTFLLGLTRA